MGMLLFTIASAAMAIAHAAAVEATEARDTLPMFGGLHSQTETQSSLSMTCDGEAPFTRLTCRFVTVYVNKPTPTEIQRRQSEAVAALRSLTPEKFLADKTRQCGPPSDRARSLQELESMKTRYPAAAGMAATFAAQCDCPDLGCFREAVHKAVELDHDVCHASADTFEVEFVRVGRARKWINKSEPSGACSMVTAIVIEEEAGSKWTYRQTRLSVDTTLPLCKELDPHREVVYETMLSPGVLGCRVVDY